MLDSLKPAKIMRMGLRLVAAVLAAAMLLQMMPVAAFAKPVPDSRDFAKAVATALGDEASPDGAGETLSTYTPSAVPEAAGIIVRMSQPRGMMSAQGAMSTGSAIGDGMTVVDSSGPLQLVEVGEGKSLEEALDELRSMDSVEYAEPNYILRAQDWGEYDFLTPEDPRYDEQWGLHRIDIEHGWGWGLQFLWWDTWGDGEYHQYDFDFDSELDEDEADTLLQWEAAQITVAVIDTGVDASHEDLSGRVLPGYNTILNNYMTADDSANGHGTHVAGIIAASTDNYRDVTDESGETVKEYIGIAGTAGKFPVSILPVKALDSFGLGTVYDVAEGIKWAADQGARVINLSLGARLFDYPRTLADAVLYAQNKGALIVAAAGNEGQTVDDFYPACLPGVISVGACTIDDDEASFSNSGSHMLAPGVDILSTLPVMDGVSRYGLMSGTSQACAFVSGTAGLILSALPGITPAQLMTGLTVGTDWNGIIDAERAMGESYSTDARNESIQFIRPIPREYEWIRVSGMLDLTVRVGDPSIVSRVEFARWELGEEGEEKVLLGVVEQGQITAGGYATIQWDTSTAPDGYLTVTATSYDVDYEDRILDRAFIYLDIANGQTSGLVIDVINPDGDPAEKALVTVHHVLKDSAGDPYYEELWNGDTNALGRVILPAAVATGGNDYLVTARGASPPFFYWKIVRAPDTNVLLTAEGTSTLEIAASRIDGSPLAGAQVSLELLGAALPGILEPDEVIDFGDWENETNLVTLLTLDASGQGSIALSPGHYNVRVTDRVNGYYLCSYNVSVGEQAATVSFGPTTGDLNLVSLTPDPACEDASLELYCDSDGHFPPIEPVTAERPIVVTSGAYSGRILAEYVEGSDLWEYEFWVEREIEGGTEHEIGFGGSLSATIETYDPGQQYYDGQSGGFALSYKDAFGNRLTRVSKNLVYVRPQVKVLDSEGNDLHVSVSTGWETAWWLIPDGIPLGQYSLVTFFDGGRFGPVESEPLDIVIISRDSQPPEPPVPFTATFLHNGVPLSDLPVYLATYIDGSYYADLYESYTGGDGKIEWFWLFEDGIVSPGDKVALIAAGTPDGWSTPLFLTRTMTIGEPPVSVTVEVGDLHEVNLTAKGTDGSDLYRPLFSVYRYETDAEAVGLPLVRHSESYLDLLVEEGEYLFQASQRKPGWDNGTCYLSQRVDVTSETPGDGLAVRLNASDAVQFSVAVPDSGDWRARAVALYPPGVTQVPVFGFGTSQLLYVSPGTYHVEGVITQGNAAYPDGLWCYWLTRDDDIVVSPSTPYEWTLDGDFDGEHTTFTLTSPDKTEFGVDEKVSARVRIEDGAGNRLVGMALNLRGLGQVDSSSLTSVRVPGGGQVFIPDPGYTVDEIGAQDHEEIAPFITVTGPEGEELHRYKDAGENYWFLMDWDPENTRYWFDSTYTQGSRLNESSTFFAGEYLIPSDAVGGDYRMVMELETGPEGSLSRAIDFKVLAVHAPPRLNAFASPFTNAESITVTGVTVSGATVTLYSSFEGGNSIVAGTATADGSGHFSVTVSLPGEGSYQFTATSTVGDATSGPSTPVSVTVDRQAPGPVRDLRAEALDSSHVRLTWSAPAQEDASGIAFYRVRRDGEIVANDLTPGENLQWQDSGLQALTEYTYDVRAVDRAGNEAEPSVVTVTTTAGQDAVRPTPPRNLTAFLSGFRASLSWEPAYDNIGVTGYKVYRWVKGEQTPVDEFVIADPNATSFSDPDYLDASTTYVYVVVACDASGNESITEGEDASGIPAAVAEVTTRALMLSGVSWSAPRVENGLLDPADSADGNRPLLKLTAIGDASRTCVATVILAGPWVNVLDDNPDNDGVYEVTLVEDQNGEGEGSGVYRGSVTIPAGTSRVVAIQCRLSDNAGHSVSAAARGLPEDFAGHLEVTVASEYPDSPSLTGAELKIWSPSLGSGGKLTVNGTGTYVFENLTPATDYQLTLTSWNKVVLAEEKDLVVSGGAVTTAVANARIRATFYVKVVREDGGIGLNSTVTVTHADGRPLAQGTVQASSGFATLTYTDTEPLVGGTMVVVSVTPGYYLVPDFMGVAGARFVLGADSNTLVVTLPQRPRAHLRGSVTAEQDPTRTMADTLIRAYQVLDGVERLVDSDRTDTMGEYELDLYEGPVRLVVSHPWGASKEIRLESPLGPNEHRVYDFGLPVQGAVSLLVKTRKLGEPEFTMDMDWRMAVHLQINLTNLGRPDRPKNVKANVRGMENGFVQIPDAEPGDRVEITADGRQCNMTTDTVEVTLDENCWALAEVNLIEKGTLNARVRDAGGNVHDGLMRYAELFKVETQGEAQVTRHVETIQSKKETVIVKDLEPGTYSVIFHWAPLPSVVNVNGMWLSPLESPAVLTAYLGSYGVTFEDVIFADSPEIDLGIVRLPLPDSVNPGRFRGVEGNELTPSKYESSPGGIITLRGSYYYDGAVRLSRPKLMFGIPYGAQLVPGSVLVTPTEGVEPRLATRPDAVELSFGDTLNGPVSGTVIYRVIMPDDPDMPVCEFRMWAQYDNRTVEDIATVQVNIPYVSIEAPSLVWSPSRAVEVSGRATPFATVRVYDSNYFLTETRASSAGTWKTTVVLPDRGKRANHFLRAEVVLAPADDSSVPSWPPDATLTSSETSSKSVTLSWPEARDVAGVTQYAVTGYLADGSVGVVRSAFPSGQGTITFRVDDLSPGTEYSFKVEAMNASYNWSEPLTCNVTTSPPDTTPPSWPIGAELTASEVKFNSLRLSWPPATDNEGLAEYRVSCSPAKGTLLRPVTVPAGTNTLLVERLDRGSEYVFTVEAIDQNGNVTPLSRSLSTLQTDTEAPEWPVGEALTTRVLDTEVTLTWPTAQDNVQISNYPIYQKSGDNWILKAYGYGNSYTFNRLSPETTYTFRVWAQDTSGNMVSSPLEAIVTTNPLDRTPPVWPPDATVTVYDKTRTGFRITIPTPDDDSGISHYAIKDHQTGLTYTGSVTYFEGLTYGQTYTYTVLAQDTRGNRTPEEHGLTFSVTVGPEDTTPPSWPPGSRLEIPEVSPHNAEVVWTPAQFDSEQIGLPSYLLQVRDEEDRLVFGDAVGQSITRWAVGQLQPGRTYTISVQAMDEWGNVSTDGPTATITTPLSDDQAPRWPAGAALEAYGLYRVPEGTYVVSLKWPQAMDFELYHYVLAAVDSNGQPAPSSPTTTQETAWHMWGLSPGETYTITVTAKDLSGHESSPITATVVTPGGMSGASVMGLGSQSGSMGAQNNQTPRVISSAPVRVEYDQDAVRIESVVMQQESGRRVEFQPVGSFVYVLVLGKSFKFDVRFNKPERVSELRIYAENGAELGGPLQSPPGPDTIVGTSGQLKGSQTSPGKLYASYVASPEPVSLMELPPFDADVEKGLLPTLWGSYTLAETPTITYDDPEENSGSAHVRAFVGGDPRIEANIDFTFTQAEPGRGTQPSISISTGQTSVHFEIEVPLDPAVVQSHLAMGSQGLGAQAWLPTPRPLVRIFGDTAVHGGLNLESLFSTVTGSHDLQNYYMDLDELLLSLNPDCPAHHVEYFESLIQIEKDRARTRKLAECVASLGSIALGIAFPGVGFAVGSWLAEKALSTYNQIEQDRNFQNLKDEIQADEVCRPEEPEPKKDLIADPTWIIDPSGYVYEVTPENRLEGVTAMALQNVGGIWTPWNATWYEQDNPLLTDAEGRYGWDVPEGQWKVSFQKEGYEPTESYVMDVPPPHTDVNVAMVTTEAPSVVSVRADSGDGVDIEFSKYMRVDTVTPGTVTVTELNADGSVKTDDVGAPIMVSGAIEPVEAVDDPRNPGVDLARAFRFVPDFPLVVGDSYRVRISQLVESYTGLSIPSDYTATVVADIVVRVTGVSLNRKSVTLEVGSSTTLSAQVIPANATDQGLSWSSSNNAVATVSQSGTVQAVATGTATITVTTRDGGHQDTCTVTVVPRSTGYTPGTGSGTQPSAPPAPPAAVLAEETFTVGPGPATIEVMGGILVLDIPAGAFPPGTKLIVRRLKDDAAPADPALSVVASPTYEILIQGSGPAKPVTVHFMYCSLCLKGMDPRKLAVYREDESNPGSYTYVGGTVDPVNHTVTVGLEGFSRYVVLGRDVAFADIADHWGRNEIEILASRYLVNGVSSTEFQPDRMITRAELAKLLVGMMALDPQANVPTVAPASPTFVDVSPAAWYYSVVETASALGFIKGDGGFFRPDDPVTRQEMAVMLGRALGKSYPVPAGTTQALPFADASDISQWAVDGVAAAWYWGLMQGVGGNTFQPLGNATRAQAAAVVLRMLELKGLVSAPATLKGTLSVSDIGGRHFELVAEDQKIYLVLPVTEPARSGLEEAVSAAASSSGIPVTIRGVLSDEPNVYMRGQVLKATLVER